MHTAHPYESMAESHTITDKTMLYLIPDPDLWQVLNLEHCMRIPLDCVYSRKQVTKGAYTKLTLPT